MDLLLAIPTSPPEMLRERALLRLNLDQYLGAARDLGNYLKLRPEAADAADVQRYSRYAASITGGRLNLSERPFGRSR